ncbi:MAG: alpha/beta fold hydrolase BchO [Paracoccaceae bacterium]
MTVIIPNWWPNRSNSEFIKSDNYNWHIQKFGSTGKKLLLIHGTGASSHSWYPLIENLNLEFEILCLDLPGHGFTRALARQKKQLVIIVDQISLLLRNIDFYPNIIMGHSAGAAVAYELAKKIETKPNTIAINAAFGQFSGLAGVAFPYFAKIASSTTIPARFLSLLASKEEIVRKLLASTGSIIPELQIKCYQYLFSNTEHVDGTLQLMADWDLGYFLDRLPEETAPIHFLVGDKDTTVPPHISKSWDQSMPNSSLTQFNGLGHLLHEESPSTVSTILENLPSSFLSQ